MQVNPAFIAHHSPKVLQNHNGRHMLKTRHKTADAIILNGSPQVQGYTKLNSMHTKLNTTMLSQLSPHMTPEQKMSRTINHVEKWLTERDQVLSTKANNDLRITKLCEDIKNKNREIGSSNGKDEKNIDNIMNAKVFVDKIKMTEKLTEKFTETPSKKAFNKDQLLMRKSTTGTPKQPSSGQQQRTTNNLNANNISDVLMNNKGAVMEYASVPINVDPSECENLLRASSDDSSHHTRETTASSTVHRYVHEHIHHHYHHFENSPSSANVTADL